MKLFDRRYDRESQHCIYEIFGIKIRVKNSYSRMQAKIDTLELLLSLSTDMTKLSKAKGSLRNIQLECLKIYELVTDICKRNNIQYWLDSGTLIGQIRHKGFIPWDDDIDLCMLRPDYEKLLSILKTELADTDYYVRERAERSNFFQIRIILKNSDNIGIDVFPVDMYHSSKLTPDEKKTVSQKIRLTKKMFDKIHHSRYMNEAQIKKAKEDIKLLTKECILDNKDIEKEKPALFWGIDFLYRVKGDLIIDYDEVFPLKEADFEGHKSYIPNQYDAYLKNIFQDYMSVPKNIVIKRED